MKTMKRQTHGRYGDMGHERIYDHPNKPGNLLNPLSHKAGATNEFRNRKAKCEIREEEEKYDKISLMNEFFHTPIITLIRAYLAIGRENFPQIFKKVGSAALIPVINSTYENIGHR